MLFGYKQGSNSAKLLSEALGIKRIKHENSKFKGGAHKLVINWGSSKLPEEVKNCMIVNKEESVSLASNKLDFFKFVEGKLSIPEFTTDASVALDWIDEGKNVVGRKKLNGHSGQGIVLYDSESRHTLKNGEQMPLYVKYIPKKDEYRVHIAFGGVIDVRRKALSKEMPKQLANFKIRTHGNGFIFAKSNLNVPQDVLDQAVKAVELCGLDFGAVDVIWNEMRQKAYVLEVNTAPGLEGSTVEAYKEAFIKVFEHHKKDPKSKNPFLIKGYGGS